MANPVNEPGKRSERLSNICRPFTPTYLRSVSKFSDSALVIREFHFKNHILVDGRESPRYEFMLHGGLKKEGVRNERNR